MREGPRVGDWARKNCVVAGPRRVRHVTRMACRAYGKLPGQESRIVRGMGDGPSKRERRSWRGRIAGACAWAAALTALGLLAFAFVWEDDPRRGGLADALGNAAFILRTGVFHIGLGLMALALVSALLRRARLGLLCVLAGATVGALTGFVSPGASGPARDDSLSVMTLNLLASNGDVDAVERAVREASPDVIVLQECTDVWVRNLSARIGGDWPHRHARREGLGQAIFSRRAFLSVGELDLGAGAFWPGLQLSVEVEHDGAPVRIVNVHTPSPASLDLISENRRQLFRLGDLAAARNQAWIIAGDFNSAAFGPHSTWLRRSGMVDAYGRVGRGRGSTWPALGIAAHGPGFRLDQVWVSRGLTPVAARVGLPTGSDHRPVTAWLR